MSLLGILRRFADRFATDDRFALVVSTLLLRVALDMGYVASVAPRWAYMGLGLQFNALKYVESWVLTLLLVWLLSRDDRPHRPSSFLVALLLAMPVLPALSFYAMSDAPRLPAYLIALGFAAGLYGRQLPVIPLPSSRPLARAAVLLCAALVGVAVVRLVSAGGLALFNLDLMEVYQYREGAAAVIGAGAWAYVLGWAFKVANVSLMTWALLRRRFDWFLGLAVLQVFFFAIDSHKALLFYPVLVAAVYVFRRLARPSVALMSALAIAMLVFLELDVIAGIGLPANLFLRRMMFIPAELDFVYYEYFGKVGHVFMSNSVLGRFLAYPLPLPTPNMIGLYTLGRVGTWANTGYLGTGYMHFGYAGAVGFAVIVGWLLAWVDAAARDRLPSWACTALVAVPFVTLFTGSDLGTALLTHGLGPAIAILVMMRGYSPPSAVKPWRVTHMTVVHPSDDSRVFRKECRSAAQSGIVTTLVAPHDRDETVDGVQVLAVPRFRSRALRMTVGSGWAAARAMARRSDIYHLHDPELLVWVPLLKMRGARVVFDAHEYVAHQILDKHWIPRPLRGPVATGYRLAEAPALALCDAIVSAEPELAARFSSHKTVVVQNFPRIEDYPRDASRQAGRPEDAVRVCYVGGVSVVRGAREMLDALAALARDVPCELVIAGSVQPPGLLGELQSHPAWERVRYLGRVAPEKIPAILAGCRAGLVVLHPRPNYVEAWPVKLFEYMAAGVPVIASDFPLWRRIVEEAGCGLLVDPTDADAIAAAVTRLVRDPDLARRMGEAGRAAVGSRYSWESQAETLLSLYGRLLSPEGSNTV